MTKQIDLGELDIPEAIIFRDYHYDLWRATTEEWYARTEAHGVRDGYAERMHGVNRACVKRYVIDGIEVWAVYARYVSGY